MRKLVVPLSVLMAVFAVAGCVRREETADDTLEYWIGASDRELVLEWGAPDSVYEFDGERRILTWRRKYTIQQEGVSYVIDETRIVNGRRVVVPVTRTEPGPVQHFECMTNFEIDARGFVVDFTRKGEGCQERGRQ